MKSSAQESPEEYRIRCENLVKRIDRANDGQQPGDMDALRAIAKELAAKCMRGNKACSACGAIAYLGALVHNEGCAVTRLEAFNAIRG